MNEEDKTKVDNKVFEALRFAAKKNGLTFEELPKWVRDLMINSFIAGAAVLMTANELISDKGEKPNEA